MTRIFKHDDLFTEDEKTAVVVGSLFAGFVFGSLASIIALGVSLIFLHVGQSFGVAIVSFWPVAWMALKLNARLCVAKRKQEKKDEVTT